MSYNAFLLILTQLAGQKRARVVVRDHVIFVDPVRGSGRWVLSSKVCQGEGLEGHGKFYGKTGAYLAFDAAADAIFLVEEIDVRHDKYIPFRAHFQEFLDSLEEWQEFFNSTLQLVVKSARKKLQSRV